MHKIGKWFSFKGLFIRKEKKVKKEERKVEDSVEQWPGFPNETGEEALNIGDPPKISKMQIKEKAAGKKSL